MNIFYICTNTFYVYTYTYTFTYIYTYIYTCSDVSICEQSGVYLYLCMCTYTGTDMIWVLLPSTHARFLSLPAGAAGMTHV